MGDKGFLILFLWLLSTPFWAIDGVTAAEQLSLDALIEEATAQNPEIQSFKKRVEASQAAVPQAGALDDPMLTIGVDNLPISDPSFDEFLPTSKVLGLSQKIPFPGKRSLKKEVAGGAAGTAEALYQDKITEIIQKMKVAYYDLFFITRSIQINERNRELLKGLADIAATKYSVGRGLQQDVLKAQVELSKILDELIVLRQKKETARARINTLLNRLPQAPLADPGELTMTKFSFTVEELQEMALKNGLPLRAMQHVIESNEAALSFAKKQYYPDFNFAVTYKQREEGDNFEGDDWFSAFVTINIPLYYKKKQDFGVVEAESKLARAHSKYVEVKNQIFFDLKDSYEEIRKGEDLIHLYEEGFLPQAKQSLDSAISGYQVDKVDFLTLVDNQLTLLKFELAYYRTLTDYEKKLAELESIVDQRLF
jgi:outer membrane protein TolC